MKGYNTRSTSGRSIGGSGGLVYSPDVTTCETCGDPIEFLYRGEREDLTGQCETCRSEQIRQRETDQPVCGACGDHFEPDRRYHQSVCGDCLDKQSREVALVPAE